MRKAPQPHLGGHGRGFLLARAQEPVPPPPRHGPTDGSQSTGDGDAPARADQTHPDLRLARARACGTALVPRPPPASDAAHRDARDADGGEATIAVDVPLSGAARRGRRVRRGTRRVRSADPDAGTGRPASRGMARGACELRASFYEAPAAESEDGPPDGFAQVGRPGPSGSGAA